jgi:hypothetical protein
MLCLLNLRCNLLLTCPVIDLSLVKMEARTPQEMFEEISNLAQTISGLSSTMRERQSEIASSSSLSPLPPTGFRRLSPGEKKLERMKEESRRLQAARTAARVAELSKSAEQNRRRRSSMSNTEGSEKGLYLNPKTRHSVGQSSQGDNGDSIPVTKRRERLSLSQPRNDAVNGSLIDKEAARGFGFESYSDHQPQASTQQGMSSSSGEITDLKELPTAVKRNITSRKSRDKRDVQPMRQPSELTSKRSRDRPQDKQYARESGNWEDLHLQKHPQTPPTPNPVGSGQNFDPELQVSHFLKRDIYDLEDEPEAFEAMMDLYEQRALLEEGYHEAIYDHETQKADHYHGLIIESNKKMHALYRISSIARVHQTPAKEESHLDLSDSDPRHGIKTHTKKAAMIDGCPPS